MVCASEGNTPKTQTTHEITMFRRFIPNPQGKAFQPSQKIRDIVEASKVDASELEEKTPLDPDIESKLIWRHFNVIKPGENVDERGRVQGTPEDDYIRGTDGADTIYGNHGSDVIYGGDGDDDLYGDRLSYRRSEGVDTIYGGAGNDLIWANNGYGQEGNDRLFAGNARRYNEELDEYEVIGSYLNGGSGDDRLIGYSGDDTLIGGSGDDHLDGGIGADTMTGGSGADTFLVGHRNEHRQEVPGVDFITDFRDAGDRIQFESIGGSLISHDDLDFSFNRAGNLLISVNTDRFSGLLAEVDGLNPNVDLWDQVQQTSINTLEVMA